MIDSQYGYGHQVGGWVGVAASNVALVGLGEGGEQIGWQLL